VESHFSQKRRDMGHPFSGRGTHSLENTFQAELNLAGGEGGVGFQEILGLLVVGGVGNSVDVDGVWSKGGGFGGMAVGGDGDALVVAVEEVERIGGELEAIAVLDVDFADEAKVGGGVIGAGEGVAAVAGEAVVIVVAVLVGIAGDGGVDGASAAGGDDAGNFPVVEHVAEESVFAVEGMRLEREGGDEEAALVGDAGAAFGVGLVRILNGGGLAGDQSVLAVIDGAGVGVGERCRRGGDRLREPCGG
jgi:hypothetical protein